MNIYLPIAQVGIDVIYIISLGLLIGFISGLLGISGGFLQTPILIFLGIPPSVAVASQSAQVIATSSTSYLAHIKSHKGDLRMGGVLLIGSIIGSTIGVYIFKSLRSVDILDITIKISYIIITISIGLFMLFEVINTKRNQNNNTKTKKHKHMAFHNWGFKYKFRQSRLYISIIPPILIGFVVGLLSSLLGIGGAFMIIPAMIYLLGMHTSVVITTALFQGIFTAINSTFWHVMINHSVDILLVALLITGSIIGSKLGTKVFNNINVIYVRLLLSILILVVGFAILFDIVTPSSIPYSVRILSNDNI